MSCRHLRPAALALATTGAALICSPQALASGRWVLSARSSTASNYSPTFTGNGFLGVRIPPAGEGYAPGSVPAQSELAGFYAVPSAPASIGDTVQQRANLPTWSTLEFGDGSDTYPAATAETLGWSQTLSLRTGVITTSGTWVAPDEHSAAFSYSVFTDRADANVGVVTLSLTPNWTGTATVTDEIDGTPATLTNPVASGADASQRQIYDEVATQGTGIDAAIVSDLATSPNVVAPEPAEVDRAGQSIGQHLTFPVTAGQRYLFTKFVGVDDSQDTGVPLSAATDEADTAALAGARGIARASTSAWSTLWAGRIDVEGNRSLATDVNASEFYLWSNTRDGVNLSISPAGLSSNGYDGHIFWDAETWMYPSLLAQHPDLALGMDNYRFARLTEAVQHASQTGYTGGRFPWESALDGTEQIPPPVSINSEGLYEMHITADVALAQWQYYLATGDRAWLASDGWPVISQAADFWTSKATVGAGGYQILGVTGPDEENPDVNDEVYTTAAARRTLLDAIAAARALGYRAPPQWAVVAAGLKVPVAAGHHPEFSNYAGQLVKQADVTMLQYPWAYPMSKAVAQDDLDYYVPRSDPGGPSMSDAVNEIDTSALNTPGCASYVYTERSVQPFIRDVFDQFSETRYGGAFTFMTGIGGFLQEFLYGYSGMRFGTAGVTLQPSLGGGISGIVLHDVLWHGREFTVDVGSRTTTLTLQNGAAFPVTVAGRRLEVTRSTPLQVATSRPNLTPTSDSVRCQAARASNSEPGAVPLAAVDGSPATGWQPEALPATLTVRVAPEAAPISTIKLLWGRLWPQVTAPNVPPAPGPVETLRAEDYLIQISRNGRSWSTVAHYAGSTQRPTDLFHVRPVRARYIRLRVEAGSEPPITPTAQDMNPPLTTPILDELTVR